MKKKALGLLAASLIAFSPVIAGEAQPMPPRLGASIGVATIQSIGDVHTLGLDYVVENYLWGPGARIGFELFGTEGYEPLNFYPEGIVPVPAEPSGYYGFRFMLEAWANDIIGFYGGGGMLFEDYDQWGAEEQYFSSIGSKLRLGPFTAGFGANMLEDGRNLWEISGELQF